MSRESEYQLVKNIYSEPVFAELLKKDPWVESLLLALFEKSQWTGEHSVRVAKIAYELGVSLSLTPEDLSNLTRGSLLHDIGKLLISAEILDKPAALTAAEQAVIDTHPRIGLGLLREIDPCAAHITGGHHEYQERPYPRQTVRKENRFAVLCALADQTDAYLSQRPYKDAWRAPEVIFQLGKNPYFQTSLIPVAINARLLLGKI